MNFDRFKYFALVLMLAMIASASVAQAQSQARSDVLVNVYDGAGHLVPKGTKVLIRLIDGNQKEVVSGFYNGPSVLFKG